MGVETSRSGGASRPGNLWINLAFNAVIPAVLLSWLSSEEWLGPVWGLVVSLLFPLVYGAWDLVGRRTWNTLSLLGFSSTLLSGGLGLMQLNDFWFAFKEAGLAWLLGLAIPASLRTSRPLVRTLLYNDQVVNVQRVQVALVEGKRTADFDIVLRRSSWLLAAAFAFSGVLNFFLALWLLPSQGGTSEFNRQLAKLQFWSWPVVMVPSSAMVFGTMMRLLREVERLTGLPPQEIFRHPPKQHR